MMTTKYDRCWRDHFYIYCVQNVDRDSQEDMKIKLLVQVAEGNVAGQAEDERIRNLIEPTLKETNLPLGSDVMVSRVTIDDFDECTSVEYNDCSNKAICTNTKGSYNCTCMPGGIMLLRVSCHASAALQAIWTSPRPASCQADSAQGPAPSVSCVTGMASAS